MSNVLKPSKKQQILALGQLGWSLRRIERETGVRRETISQYLRGAGIPIRPPRSSRLPRPNPASNPSTDPRGPEANPASNLSTDPGRPESNPASYPSTDSASPARGVSTDSGDSPVALAAPLRMPSSCEPYRPFIEQEVAKGRNAMGIYQDLVDDHGFKAGYSSVRRFVRRLVNRGPRDAHPILSSLPGEEGQVDYGDGPMVRHPKTGNYRRTRLFVYTLAFSRKSVRLLTFQSSSRIWCELHERAWRRLGGVPRTNVLDNLKEGVLKPDVYEPELNPLFAAVLDHYGVTGLPCRVGHSDRKGKVERGVGHAQGTALKGKRFETLEEAQAYLDRWEERWADTRIHGTTKRQVAAQFELEKPSLRALPELPFRYFEYGKRTVGLHGCIEVQGAYYAAPHGYLGREVAAQWDGHVVRVLDLQTGNLLREHLCTAPGRVRQEPRDRPRRTPPGMLEVLARAAKAGKSIGALCQAIYADDEVRGVGRVRGVLHLAKKHGPVRTEEACTFALQHGQTSYRFVKRFLDHHPPEHRLLRQVDPLLRELTEYRDLIHRRLGIDDNEEENRS
ncbi:MAG: IS21 family transposase [Acidobacteria bacterium]|nr:IS21 family transposase [Acidobacteriota bacterium]